MCGLRGRSCVVLFPIPCILIPKGCMWTLALSSTVCLLVHIIINPGSPYHQRTISAYLPIWWKPCCWEKQGNAQALGRHPVSERACISRATRMQLLGVHNKHTLTESRPHASMPMHARPWIAVGRCLAVDIETHVARAHLRAAAVFARCCNNVVIPTT